MLRNISKLYEDDCCVVFDKPPGILVIPAPNKNKRTLTDIVNSQNTEKSNFSLHPCHRLDKDTSGVILFAKGKKNQKQIMDLFRNRKVYKEYIALIHGKLTNREGAIKKSIKAFDSRKFNAKSHPKFAITRYKTIKVHSKFSVLEVYPETGRTNQIRVHFAQIGHPLVGERKYSFAKDFDLKFRRTALHASTLKWKHHVYGRNIVVNSKLAEDIKNFISKY